MNTNSENKSSSLTFDEENSIEIIKDSSKQLQKNNNENLNNSYLKNEKKIIKIFEKINHKKISNMLKLERHVFKKFNNFYSNEEDFYNLKIINEIISNESTHIVALFKDNLINGDNSEFLQKNYSIKEINQCLPKIFQYYDSYSVIFPNYVILPESKYIYKNIQRKQRVIDNQQELESKLEKIKKGIIKIKDDDNQIFNTIELDSILDQTDTSGIRRFFGINKSESNLESRNISVENIIKRISNAENYIKDNNNSNYINNNNSKIKNDKKKININFITINSSKGRNNVKNMNDSNNNNKKDSNNNGINSLNSISKNTKVSSMTIDLDNKNQNNNLIHNYSNTIYVNNSVINNNNNSIKNNNNNLSINNNNHQDVKKQNLMNNLLLNKNKDDIIKTFDEKNKNKSNHHETQIINTLHSKKKIKTSKKNILPPTDNKLNNKLQFNKISSSTNHIKTLSSSLSSPKKGLINTYHNKNNLSMSKLVMSPNFQSVNKKSILHSKTHEKKNDNLIRALNLRENIHFVNRENLTYEYMNILNSKIKKIKTFNKRISSIPKKKFTQSYSYNNSNNKKEYQTLNNESERSRQINYRNRNFNFNLTENLSIPLNSKFFSPEIKLKREISNSPKKFSEKKVIKTYSHFHSNSSYLGNNNKFTNNNNEEKVKNKKIRNSVFPKQDINFKGFHIKGFKEILQNNNKFNSRNSKGSNSERILLSENNGSQTNRNLNFSSKTFMDVYVTIHNRK